MSHSLRNRDDSHPRGAGFVPLLLFFSGALALIYETAWQREFALVFGSAAPATAAVLAAYFAGLGLGAWAIGRIAGRWRRPLRVYAVLEGLVGLGAWLVSPTLGGLDAAYPWLLDTLGGSGAGLTLARTGAAFVALFIPTFCMGGTLPVLGAMIDQGAKRWGISVGWLYVVNTTGAGLGALMVPFLLMPRLGLNGTVWLGAAMNGLLALTAWWLDHRLASRSPLRPPVETPLRSETRSAAAPVASQRPVMILAMISGIVTFALQVLWNRAFAQVHENSLYSFSVIVAVVIFALAIGGQFARIGLRRGVEPCRLLGGGWMLGGLAVLIGPWLFIRLSDGLSYLPAGNGWFGDACELIRLAAAVLLVPMALLGLGLPAVMEQAGRDSDETTSRSLGKLLGVNVAGSVAGALLAGFVLPAWLGVWGGMMWLGALIAMAGLWQWFGSAMPRKQHVLGYALLAGWIVSAVAFGAIDLSRVRLVADRGETLLWLAEGAHGITAVVGRDGARRLKLNNFYSLGGTKATADERMQAHLPLLLHPDPQQVAFLGLGTGITAGGALFHPVRELTVIELVPEVVTAARAFFGDANRQVLNDARTRVVHDDARHFLRGSGARFDVIVGDLVVPWRQGEGALFTLEQFKAARLALKPGGLFCQWLPLFQLSETELNILIRTFLSVFPEAEVWRGDFSATDPALALVSRPVDFAIDVKYVERRLTGMESDPTNPQLAAESVLWMHRVGVLRLADLPAAEMRLNTEDRPWIELLGPMLHAGGNREQLFVGRRLQAWIEHVSRTTRERSTPLSVEAARGVLAGALFAELVLCVDEGNGQGAHSAQEKLKQTLPADSYRWFIAR